MPRHALPRRSFRHRAAPAGAGESRAINGQETWIPRKTRSGSLITPHTAATIASAYAAIVVLSSDVGVIPFNVMRRGRTGGKAVDWSSPLQDLIFWSPDGRMSAQTWRECQMWHGLTWGNAYSRTREDGLAEVESYELLDPQLVQPAETKSGELYYRVGGEPVPAAQIIHVRAPGYNGVNGLSPVSQCRESLGLTEAVEGFGQNYFGNGIKPTGILTFDNDPDEEAIREIRRDIEARNAGFENAHKIMTLTGGARWTPTTIPLNDAQFLLTRGFQLEEVCRIFRVPATKLQSFEKASFASLEELNLDYYQSSLLPWLMRIEFELTLKSFSPKRRRSYWIEHDRASLLKGRMLDQAQVFKILRELGVMTSNEIAAHYGLAPHEGGDAHLVQLNQGSEAAIGAASLADLKGVKPEAGAAKPADGEAARSLALVDLALEAIGRHRADAEAGRIQPPPAAVDAAIAGLD